MGPFTPPLSAPLNPRALEGRDWTLARQSCASTQLHARTQVHSTGTPSSHGSDSKWLGCLVGSTLETKQPSQRRLTCLAPPPGVFQRITWWQTHDDSCLGASRPRSLPLGMQSLLRMCACSCVLCIYTYVALQKQPSLWGSWTLHVRVSPKPLGPPPCCLKGPASLHLLICQHCCFLRRIMGNSRTLLPSTSALLSGRSSALLRPLCPRPRRRRRPQPWRSPRAPLRPSAPCVSARPANRCALTAAIVSAGRAWCASGPRRTGPSHAPSVPMTAGSAR